MTYPPLFQLVPHEPPMLWLDALVHWQPGLARAEARVMPDSALVHAGRLHAAVTLEYMAQTVAAYLGYEAYSAGKPVRVGMVVACRDLHLAQEWLHVGTQLVIVVHKQSGDETLSRFSAEVSTGGARVAQATLTLLHGDPGPQLRRPSQAL
jgi:predicted hotdog family 3-hydroxylacyl-ACP dehydratase